MTLGKELKATHGRPFLPRQQLAEKCAAIAGLHEVPICLGAEAHGDHSLYDVVERFPGEP